MFGFLAVFGVMVDAHFRNVSYVLTLDPLGIHLMINRLILSWAIFLVSQTASAEGLFSNCSDFIGKKSYQPLNRYLSEKSEEDESAIYCQRLNKHEFVYTTNNNFYYCNFKSNNTSACYEHAKERGRWYPNLDIETRFSGGTDKNFILFKTSRLSRGVLNSAYQVFFFTPKKENPRGYKVIDLEDAGEYNGLYSDGGEICSNLNDDDQATEAEDKGYEIVNEGKINVGIRFRQKKTSCKTQSITSQILEYTWSGNNFIGSKNKINQ